MTRSRNVLLSCATLCLILGVVAPALARVIEISPISCIGSPRSDTGDGLIMRFKDLDSGCGIALGMASTDTVTVNIATMPNINFLLNTGCTIGPFYHGCGYFATRWDSYLNIKVPGDYIFSEQVDDCAQITIGDSTVLLVDGANWFVNQVSDTVRFSCAGSYRLRAYFSDCQPCCRGFRLGGMGPAGSGMMAFTPGFDFNNDLGPCCTTGANGPGLSVVPAALFFTSFPVAGVGSPAAEIQRGTIQGSRAWPNPCAGNAEISVALAAKQRVWGEVVDALGRKVCTLADGETVGPGWAQWPWKRQSTARGAAASGSYFYHFRAEDGSTTAGRIVIVR